MAPRCRLITSWLGIIFQGLICSIIKVVRELGSKRRETVWSLSVVFYEKKENLTLVREDREGLINDYTIIELNW